MAIEMNKDKLILGQMLMAPVMKNVAEMEVKVSTKLDMSIEEHIEMDLHIHADALASSIGAARSMGMGFDMEKIFELVRERVKMCEKLDDSPIEKVIDELMSNL